MFFLTPRSKTAILISEFLSPKVYDLFVETEDESSNPFIEGTLLRILESSFKSNIDVEITAFIAPLSLI